MGQTQSTPQPEGGFTGLRPVHDDGGEGFVPTDEDILINRKQTVPVVFRWEYGGKEVYISGSFNGWKTRIPLSMSGGEFTTIIELPSGVHYFKYLVDGNWIHDPNQPYVDLHESHLPDTKQKTENDTYGGRNNMITVKESDFDATEALLKDEGVQKVYDGSNHSSSTGRQSPPGEYGHVVPSPHDPVIMQDSIGAAVPPTLPPHLLNGILNQETDQEDPTVLPVPNHVALNHLYALSIKESVMTLSATHRYKRKYVTTVLYKPISAS